MPGNADLVHWAKRFEVVERRIDAERRAHPLTPEESLRRASELRRLAHALGVLPVSGAPSEEDLGAYRVWARLRRAFRPTDA